MRGLAYISCELRTGWEGTLMDGVCSTVTLNKPGQNPVCCVYMRTRLVHEFFASLKFLTLGLSQAKILKNLKNHHTS